MDEQLVDEINMECHGYGGSGEYLIPACKSVNELLHLLHSYIVNNENILQSMPKLAETKINSNNRNINLYGVESDLARRIFDEFPLEENYGTTDIVSLDDRIIMMVRDRGHALSLEITQNEENGMDINYFIPKICNYEIVNNLKGVRKAQFPQRYTKGRFSTLEETTVQELYELISAVPGDMEIPRLSREEQIAEIRRQIEEDRRREAELIEDAEEQPIVFSEQQIGKATINASVTIKKQATQQVARDEQEIEHGEKDDK